MNTHVGYESKAHVPSCVAVPVGPGLGADGPGAHGGRPRVALPGDCWHNVSEKGKAGRGAFESHPLYVENGW